MPPPLKATHRNSTNATNAVTEAPPSRRPLDRKSFPRIRRFAVGVDEEFDEAIDCPFHIRSRLRRAQRRSLENVCERSVTLLVLMLRAIFRSQSNLIPQSGTCCAKRHDTKQASSVVRKMHRTCVPIRTAAVPRCLVGRPRRLRAAPLRRQTIRATGSDPPPAEGRNWNPFKEDPAKQVTSNAFFKDCDPLGCIGGRKEGGAGGDGRSKRRSGRF